MAQARLGNDIPDVHSRAAGEIVHPLGEKDRIAVAAMPRRPAADAQTADLDVARRGFDAMTEQTHVAPGVEVVGGEVGGVRGVWCRPPHPNVGAAILYLHGGAYSFGSARAFSHLAGHIAMRTNVLVFIVDYRLAPEHVFPAALDDARAAYRGLAADGFLKIAIAGDSSGGGMALALLSVTRSEASAGDAVAPAAAVAMSPWTDLALSGPSMVDRAEDDPLLTRNMLANASAIYRHGQEPHDPLASPLYGSLAGLPALQIHVGTNEILLDDSRRYGERARDAGVDATVHIWEGMMHVFASRVGTLDAADEALNLLSSFLRARLQTPL